MRCSCPYPWGRIANPTQGGVGLFGGLVLAGVIKGLYGGFVLGIANAHSRGVGLQIRPRVLSKAQ